MAINPLYDPNTDNQQIHAEKQDMINTPLAGGQVDGADLELLNSIKALVEAGSLNFYAPSSLVNQAVYEALDTAGKARVDTLSVTMMSKVRQVMQFHKLDMDTNYQEKNLLHSLRLDKEAVEAELGDVFVI